MAEWYYLSIKLPEITETTNWTIDSISEIFSEMDYDFPKTSLNGYAVPYRNPRLSAEQIVEILFDKFGIDDAVVCLSGNEYDDEDKNVTYKSVYAFKIQETKFKNNIDKLVEKYELQKYTPYVSYSDKTNWRGPRFYIGFTINLCGLEFRTSFECSGEYSGEFFDAKFAAIAKIITKTNE